MVLVLCHSGRVLSRLVYSFSDFGQVIDDPGLLQLSSRFFVLHVLYTNDTDNAGSEMIRCFGVLSYFDSAKYRHTIIMMHT